MNIKMDNIEVLDYSREMMERKPSKLVSTFIYILLAAIFAFILWTCISNKETVVNISGSALPKNDSLIITNKVSGIIKSIYAEDGQCVKEGDILYIVDDSELQNQKNQLDLQKTNSDIKMQNLNKFINSINDNINYFTNCENEKEYYYKFESYKSEDNSSYNEKDNLLSSKSKLNTNINKFQLLAKSINDNTNYNEANTIYDTQFKQFQLSKTNLLNKLSQLETNKSKAASDYQTSNLNLEIESIQNELSTLTLNTQKQIQQSIDDLNTQIETIDRNINTLDENSIISKEKNKTALLADIEAQKSILTQEIQQLNFNIEQYNKNIESCTVKAEADGKLDLRTTLKIGSSIQAGTDIANILPDNNIYKIQLLIPEKYIANIEEGQEVKYSFTSLPSNEYGFLTGTIENLSVNSKLNDETGTSFYIGTASLDSSSLYGHNNKEVKVKSGMTCQARIITKRTKMIYYILDQLKLITS